MRLKTDENLHPEIAEFLRSKGHDAVTVWDEDLRGAADDDLMSVCAREDRIMLTADLDYSDIRHFPPTDYPGIIVFRPGGHQRRLVLARLQAILWVIERQFLRGDLWIVTDHSIRVRRD